jgi:HK97 family phage portal protein
MVYSGGNVRYVNLGDENPVTPARWVGGFGGFGGGRTVGLADPAFATYDAIYASQRWVRTAVDFLARNVAQCQIHVYRRLPNDDRVRLRSGDHPFAAILDAPDPSAVPPLTAYRWILGIVADAAVYGNAYTAKLPDPDQSRQFRLSRVEPAYVYPNSTDPTQFVYAKPGLTAVPLHIQDLIWARAWSPTGVLGLSLLEPLREMLHEEYQAAVYRNQLWRSGARMSGWISRPVGSTWSSEAQERFRQDWKAAYSGSGPDAGGTPLLEEGMEFHPQTFSAEQAQFLETRELAREEVAAALQIQPTMLGMTKGATYANMQQHHQMLYQDTLGPIFGDIEQELMLQLLPDLAADNDGVYCEFNIQEKLSGTFEEQAVALQSAVGRPYLTANEARARMNLPRIDTDDADSIVLPLNVTVSGSPEQEPDSWDEPPPPLALPAYDEGLKWEALPKSSTAEVERYREELASKLTRYFRRQGSSVGSALGADAALPDAFDFERWDPELSDLLLRQSLPIASSAAFLIIDQYPGTDWSNDPMIGRLSAYAGDAASGINHRTYQLLAEALAGGERSVRDIYTAAMSVRAPQIAQTTATFAANLGQNDAALVVGLRFKTWRTTSENPRPACAAMNGQRVAIGSVFSNGARYPGDPILDLDQRSGCRCRVEYDAREG